MIFLSKIAKKHLKKFFSKQKLFLFLRILSIFILFLSGFLGAFNIIPNTPNIYPNEVQAVAGTATYNSSSSWTAQATSVTVDVWGGGGGGGGGSVCFCGGEGLPRGGGGGGGGAYSQKIVTGLTLGTSYTVTVGTGGGGSSGTGNTGGTSWFQGSTTVAAVGGVGGTTSTGGAGGASASGYGTTKTSGGNGGSGTYTYIRGGGGGSGGNSTGGGNGGTGTAGAAGTGTPPGAMGGISGSSPAPGGGGYSGNNTGAIGADGAAGRVTLTWSINKSSSNPSDDATGVAADIGSASITFDGYWTAGTGDIRIVETGVGTFQTIPIASATGSGTQTLTIPGINQLNGGTNYHIEIDSAAVVGYAGIADSTTWNFTTADVTAPTITNISSNKANATYTTGEVIDIDVTFSEAVTSTGNVTVTLETGDTDRTCTFAITNSTTGTCDYTVQAGDTSSDLDASITGTIADQSSNALTSYTPGTSLATNKALVIDAVNPTVSTLSPTDNATGVATNANLIITFSESVDAEAGASNDIVIKKTSDNSTVENLDVQQEFITGSGTNTITINPTVTLVELTGYYVQIGADAFDDAAGNSYAGISDTTSWSFTTADETPPTISSIESDKANGSYKAGEVIDIDVYFSESVTSTGSVTVTLETGTTDQTCTFTVTNSASGTCNYTVQAGDNSSDLDATVSGTIADQGSNALTNYTPSTTLASFKNIVIDTTSPVISSVSSTPGGTSASIEWTTNESSSSQVLYGPTSSYGSTTSETDTSPRVSSHSVILSSLVSCSTYHYSVRSRDTAGNAPTSSDDTFTTSCPNSAPVVALAQGNIDRTTGGSRTLTSGTANIEVTAPVNYSASTANFQIHQITKSTFLALAGNPTSTLTSIGTHIYNLTALTDSETSISSFDDTITITVTYTASEVSGYDESSLVIYRWDGTSWSVLTGCSVDTAANTVTCTTTAFSTFALFGTETSTSSSSSSSTSSQSSTTNPPLCSDVPPQGTPYIFQIDSTSNSAKLYFTPIQNITHYIISYSTNPLTLQHSADIDLTSSGVQNYTVKGLKANTIYYFKVRGQAGCATGSWSNLFSSSTPKSPYSLSSIISTLSTPLKNKASVEKVTIEKGQKQDVCSYTIKGGDTLWNIAQGTLGDGSLYPQIISLNKNKYKNIQNSLKTGWTLQLPCKDVKGVAKKAKQPKSYDVTIKVMEDEKPLANVSVELHSDPQYGKTDKKGIVRFKDVAKGEHKLLLAYKVYTAEQKLVVGGDSKDFKVALNVSFKPYTLLPFWGWGLIVALWLVSLYFVSKRKYNDSFSNNHISLNNKRMKKKYVKHWKP